MVLYSQSVHLSYHQLLCKLATSRQVILHHNFVVFGKQVGNSEELVFGGSGRNEEEIHKSLRLHIDPLCQLVLTQSNEVVVFVVG